MGFKINSNSTDLGSSENTYTLWFHFCVFVVLLTKFTMQSIDWAGKIEKSYIIWIGFRHLVWFREFKWIDLILLRGVHNNTGPNPTRGISIIKKKHTPVLTANTSGKTVKTF